MSFLTRLRDFKDSILVRGISNTDFWLLKAIQRSSGSAAGVSVTADSALAVSAVYACVKVLAETIASLPLMLYERKGDGKEPASKHPLYPLLHDAPNDLQTSFEWREDLVAHIALRGNTYNQKVESGSGKLLELIPLNPINMNPVVKDGRVIYEYAYEDGKQETFPAGKIWHVKNMPISCSYSGGLPEGVIGLSPISVARESVGLSLAADQYGGRYFSNNATVGLALSYPDGVKLADSAKQFLKESLAEYAKSENKFKSMILENGGKLEKIGMSNEDSQFLQSRQFQIEEIARIFRVPPIMIGHPTNTMTYASAEQLFLAFATYTIRPWCVRLEQSMNRYLIPERERGRYFFEFNLAGLLRGDTKSMYEAFNIGHNGGWLNADEIRSLINMNPLPDGKGKVYLQPLNMVEAGTKPEPPPPGPEKPIGEPIPKPKKSGRKAKGDNDNA